MTRSLFILATVFGFMGCSDEEAPPQKVVVVDTIYTAPAVTKWVYKCIPMEEARYSEELQLQFNRLGNEGYEMVGYTITNGACFKRPMPL